MNRTWIFRVMASYSLHARIQRTGIASMIRFHKNQLFIQPSYDKQRRVVPNWEKAVRHADKFTDSKKSILKMDSITKDDLQSLRLQLIHDIKNIFKETMPSNVGTDELEWLRSKTVRNILSISPATLQNIRISGKIRFKKIMGSYYYNREDIVKLFDDERT